MGGTSVGLSAESLGVLLQLLRATSKQQAIYNGFMLIIFMASKIAVQVK